MNANAELRAGVLLVATPQLSGPVFGRTVIYLVAHSQEGTLGVVLNKPSETPVHNLMQAWTALAVKAKVIFIGGPMRADSAMCVGVCKPGVKPRELDGVAPIVGPVCLVDVDADPAALAPYLRGVRIYGGHAGWSPGQLAQEVEEGSWYVVPGRADDVLFGPRTDLWFSVLRRQPFPLKWQAWHPVDLERN